MAGICGDIATMLRKTYRGFPGVTVELEDSCDPNAAAEKALGGWGVLVLVAASGHRRSRGSGASTVGEVDVVLTVIENPKRNRKSGMSVPTVTSVSEAARDALHWQIAGTYSLDYVDMQREDAAEDDFREVLRFVARPKTGPTEDGRSDTPEPEEVVEGIIAAMVKAAMPGWKVVGALAPAPEGEMREMPETCIAVSADVESQALDWSGPGVPCAYRVNVEVRCSDADDRTGECFRAACRRVRAALQSLLGDRCSALDGEGFECDSFVLGSTETPLGDGDSTAKRKTYQATVVGRFIPQTENQEADNGKPNIQCGD